MSASSHVTTPKDIRQAASALEGVAVRTNLERSERLSAEAGVDILLKREDQQKCPFLQGARRVCTYVATVPRRARAWRRVCVGR